MEKALEWTRETEALSPSALRFPETSFGAPMPALPHP
jgi:hypothetical protein